MKTLASTENSFRNPIQNLFWHSESRIWLLKCSKKIKAAFDPAIVSKATDNIATLYYCTTFNFIIPFGNMLFPMLTAE